MGDPRRGERIAVEGRVGWRDTRLGRRLAGSADVGVRDLVELRHEPVAAAVLERFVAAWGSVVVSMCHAYDPDVVVLSGGVMRARDLLPRITEFATAHLWASAHRPRIVAPERPEWSVLRGVAALVTRELSA